MAVYTSLADDEIAALLRTHYALGALVQAQGIAQGVENTNYLLSTQAGEVQTRYILTLFEKRVQPEEVPFFMALMEHVAEAGVPCPLPMHRRDGGVVSALKNKSAAVVSFLHGRCVMVPDVQHIASLGAMVARMHKAVDGFSGTRANALSLAGWQGIYTKIAPRLDEIRAGLSHWVGEELAYVAQAWPHDLPLGVVHADIFPDNIFFDGDAVSGVIDFYFACEDFFAYDLAIVMNAWCFTEGVLVPQKAQALFAEYCKVRALSAAEIEALPVLARGAALRFLLTRAHDWLYRDAGAMVTAKDPMEYVAALEFHQRIRDATVYGV